MSSKNPNGILIVPGRRVMDTSDSRDNVCGVCLATDDRHVVFRVDEGPADIGSLAFVEWALAGICPQIPSKADHITPLGRSPAPPKSSHAGTDDADTARLESTFEPVFKQPELRAAFIAVVDQFGKLDSANIMRILIRAWNSFDDEIKSNLLHQEIGATWREPFG